jgi:hypothetical protein
MDKWHACIRTLGGLRREVCYYLNPRRHSGEHGPENRAKAKAGARVIPMEWYQGRATSSSPADLKSVFVKVDRFVNTPVAELPGFHHYGLAPSHLFIFSSQCRICGLPLLPGEKICRSALCQGMLGKMGLEGGPAASDRGTDNGKNPFESEDGPAKAEEHEQPNPESGMGGRDLECEYYDACLNLAVFCEWESFHCERCELRRAAPRSTDLEAPATGPQCGPLKEGFSPGK